LTREILRSETEQYRQVVSFIEKESENFEADFIALIQTLSTPDVVETQKTPRFSIAVPGPSVEC
jgi:hypothetical protein